MTATTLPPALEADADPSGAPGGRPDRPGPPGGPEPEAPDYHADDRDLSARTAVALAFPVAAACVMVGGVFVGPGGRVVTVLAGLGGLAVAWAGIRIRSPVWCNAATFGGVFAIGLAAVLPSGAGNLGPLRGEVARAVASGSVLRPPVAFTPGWHAVAAWTAACIGLAAGWVAFTFGRPVMALLVPLAASGVAGISVPKEQQAASGVTVLLLFGLGVAVLAGSGGDEGERPLGYELRRLARTVPLLALVTAGLIALTQAHFLFPHPVVDPTQRPQKPRATPLSAVKDRVLFEVESTVSGPWRLGSLDVYDGHDWRLAPLAQSRLLTVPRSGLVDPALHPGEKATFIVSGLGGAVLPSLPNTVGILAEGPRLAYDSRSGNVRLTQGQIQAGLTYTVTAAALPTVQQLAQETASAPGSLAPFLQIPPPPPAVAALIQQADGQFPDRWDRFNFLRTYILNNVTSAGPGTPTSVTPERVQDMLAGSKEASPFEIVAAQAMVARWVGVPSRIGYGFDGGDVVDGRRQIRPRDGASFVEVDFPTYGWLPVIGVPTKAKPTTGDASQQRQDASVLPSGDIPVQLFIPIVLSQPSVFLREVQRVVAVTVPAALLLFLLYLLLPALLKAIRRTQRRTAAQQAGPRARIALAYCEWRDHAADYGYGYPTDTPLQYLRRFAGDEEQEELAWLVTRSLWGDLRDGAGPDEAAAAEELSRALRRRLSLAHPPLLRLIAAVSRVSLRDPYAVGLGVLLEKGGAPRAAAA